MRSPGLATRLAVMRGNVMAWYLGILVPGFCTVYLLTRSSILVGDGLHFISMARAGNPLALHYGEPSHFLQVPLARAIWLALARLRLPVSIESVSLGISLAGTLAAIVFFGLIASELLDSRPAAWLGAILFGTSLNISTQWNGELYGLALGFVTGALYFALRGRLALPALLWALSVLSHSEFALAAPALAGAVWMAAPGTDGARAVAGRIVALCAMAGGLSMVILIAGSRVLGKWSDAASLNAWIQRSLTTRQPDLMDHPEAIRALKGLLTAFTVGGHYWRDILTGRGAAGPVFLLAAAVGLFVIVLTLGLLAASVSRPQVFWFGLVWLVPFHVLVNWWFVPTVEKYHAGALPGFVLLVTGGLIALGARLPSRRRYLLYVVYSAAFAGLNFFGALLPMHIHGREVEATGREIRHLADAGGGRAAFVACDEPKVLLDAGVPYLRVRSIWTGTVADIQQALTQWTSDRLREGKDPIVVGRWCLPEEWKTKSSKEPFDLLFLGEAFRVVPTGITDIPISDSIPTNPFSWTRGDLVRLARR